MTVARPVYPEHYKRLKRKEATRCPRALNFACFHNQPFLRSDRACRWLADALRRALPLHNCHLWAYCFMPTHAHILVFPRAEQPDLSAFLESVKKSATRRALAWIRKNTPHFLPRMLDEQPSGAASHRFWERGGGYDRNLWSPRALWNMIDYIHHNPVKDGLCQRPTDWPWSSAARYARGQSPIPLNLEHLPPDARH
jgi:putative transposase